VKRGNNFRYPARKWNVNNYRRVGIIDINKFKKIDCDDILDYTCIYDSRYIIIYLYQITNPGVICPPFQTWEKPVVIRDWIQLLILL